MEGELAFCTGWFWFGISICLWVSSDNDDSEEGEKKRTTFQVYFEDDVLYLSKGIVKNKSMKKEK